MSNSGIDPTDPTTMAAKQPARSFETMLQSAQAGDAAGYDFLYATYAGRILGFAVARRAVDPESVTNEVMLRAFQRLGSFEGDESAFVRWLFTIARNQLIDLHRAAARRPVVADVAVPEQLESSAEDDALDQLDLERVLALLDVLTAEQREVIALRLIDDLSLADVAEIVGRPVTAVKALQRRGLRRIQKEILGEEVP